MAAGISAGSVTRKLCFGDRLGDAGDVRLLEGVGADGTAGHLPGDRDHGHGVHVGVGQRGHEVGRARAGGRHADAHPAGGGGVSLRRVPGTLLVAHQDVPDLLGVHERVIGGQDRPAGNAEHGVDADLLKAPSRGWRRRSARCRRLSWPLTAGWWIVGLVLIGSRCGVRRSNKTLRSRGRGWRVRAMASSISRRASCVPGCPRVRA